MDGNKFRQTPLPEVVDRLRRAGHTWFRNEDLLLLEELIRRAQMLDAIHNRQQPSAEK